MGQINHPPNKQDFKTFEINNKSIALNVLECNSQQKIRHLYKSEFNKTREKQIILLMISNEQQQQQHYLAVKKLNSLLRRKDVHVGYSYCLNCFQPLRTKSRLNSHKS